MTKGKFTQLLISFFAVILCLNFIGLAGSSNTAHAQGTVNINVVGIPPLLKAPFPDKLKQNFQTGKYRMIFVYTNSNQNPVKFRFRFRLTKGGRELFEVTSEPKTFRPGAYVFTSIYDELPFSESYQDVFDQVDADIKNQIIQGGSIPEGNYTFYVKAIPEDGTGFISSIQSVTPFTVRYPMAPILINPTNNSNLTLETPVFNWTPISIPAVTMQYNFLLVEVYDNQTPLQAINSNRAIAEKQLTASNTLIYTPQYLPLEEGKKYAWRVTASSAGGDLAIKNEGESEIYSFVYKKEGVSTTLSDLGKIESISLIPNFATLTNLGSLEAREAANSYILNGSAELELNMLSGVKRVRVRVNNLRLQKNFINSPNILGGSVNGSAEFVSSLLAGNTDILSFTNLSWALGKGITIHANVNSAGNISVKSRLKLRKDGLSGTIRATGSPIISLNENMVTVDVTELEVSFPGGRVKAGGALKVLGKPVPCDFDRLVLIDNEFAAWVSCDEPIEVPLVEGSDFATMTINSISGSVSIGKAMENIDLNLEMNTTIGLKTMQGEYCGTNASVVINESGFNVSYGMKNCDILMPKIDLGFFKLQLTETELSELDWDPSTEQLAFKIDIGAKFTIPGFGAWKSYEFDDIVIDEDGIHFPEINFGTEFAELPEFDVNGYLVKLQELLIKKFNFPVFEWDENGPGPWELTFSGGVTVPNSGLYPECVRGMSINLRGGKVEGNRVVAKATTDNFTGCTYNFGSGYSISIESLGGLFGIQFNDDDTTNLIGRLALDGGLELGTPFTCGTDGAISIESSHFIFTTALEGTVEGVVPSCDLVVGPFTAQVDQSKLIFSKNEDGSQAASLAGTANLDIGSSASVNGDFTLNLMTGNFESLNFVLDEPFEWNIPEDDPVLTFAVDRARITEDGFTINGRNELILGPDKKIGVTFDNLNLSLQRSNVKTGRVIFDEAFALAASIDPTDQSLGFKAVEVGSELQSSPGMYLELAGQLMIDSLGIHANGQAAAKISYNDQTYGQDTQVEFTDDFAIQLYPFKVGSGRADLLYKQNRVAYVDQGGFHIEPGFFAELLIPDILPLPARNIAYIKLRDENGNLLVNVTENEDGNYAISTKQGQGLTLYAPFLNAANPAELVNVALNDVVLSGDPTDPGLVSGSISVDVPAARRFKRLADAHVPLNLKKLVYGYRTVEGRRQLALYLLGQLNMLNTDLASSSQVAFYIRSDGAIQAQLALEGLDGSVPILEGGQVALAIDSVGGNFNLPMGSIIPDFDFYLRGDLQIETKIGYSSGAAFVLNMTPSGLSVVRFEPTNFELNSEIDFGPFGLKLDSVKSIPKFSYDPVTGFDFALTLDVGLRFTLSDDQEFTIPLEGLEIQDTGIVIPPLDISEASIVGLNLPSFAIAGFELKPIALKTGAYTFNWSSGTTFSPDVDLTFELRLPEFENFGENIPDGLTVNVGFEDGYLTGDINAFSPIGGMKIYLIPGNPNSPAIRVSKLYGAFKKLTTPNGFRQAIDLNIEATLEDIPLLQTEEVAGCDNSNIALSLSIVDGKYFNGSIGSVEPCGYLKIGPARLSITTASLAFAMSDDQQRMELEGGVRLELPSPSDGAPITAEGNVTIDLIEGDINNGSITIDQPFEMNFPFEAETPLFKFTVNNAVLDATGFMLNADGKVKADDVVANVQFNDLKFGFDEFEIISGSANIESAFALKIGILPLDFQLRDPEAPLADNALNIGLNSDLTLNSSGFGISGAATANLLYGGEEYLSLKAAFQDGFTFNAGGLAVNKGKAIFYTVEKGIEDPLAVLDTDGIDFSSIIASVLPDTLPLPDKNIAYAVIKDNKGELLVDIVENESGGYTISTTGSPLDVVIPGLVNPEGRFTKLQVEFDLETDDSYAVTGGTLTLQSNYDLEQALGLPVTLTKLSLIDGENGIELEAGLKVELPQILESQSEETTSLITAVLTQNGIKSGSFTVGNYNTRYDSEAEPLYTFSIEGGEEETASEVFSGALMGVKATFGESKSIHIAGTFSSSLIMDIENGDEPLFYTASWASDEGWGFAVDPGETLDSLALEAADFVLNKENGIGIHDENGSFYLTFNGKINMKDVLGEPLEITVRGLEVGVDNYDGSDPSLHFTIAQATGDLRTQEFRLFEGALKGTIKNPTIELTGTTIAISSETGTLTFLDQDINYTGLLISTAGDFTFDQIETENIEIIPNYLSLKSMTLEQENGLKLTSELKVTLPAPVNESAIATLVISRKGGLEAEVDQDVIDTDQIKIETTQLAFNINEKFNIGNFGYFMLTKVGLEIDPFTWTNSGIYANGELYEAEDPDSPIITFGESSNMFENAGIEIRPAVAEGETSVQFNITGSKEFSKEFSLFEVTFAVDQISTSEDGFELVLNGSAGITLDGASGELGYEGFTVNQTGITDYGNLTGSGTISLKDIATVSVGQFVYKEYRGPDKDPISIDITSMSEQPSESTQQTVTGVEELLCFGPCPVDIEGETQSSAAALNLEINVGGFNASAGVGSIFYYETDSEVRLVISDFETSIGSHFSMTADFAYMNNDSNGSFLLRAAATGTLSFGNTSVDAVLAGKFAQNAEGRVSYGLFVAAQSSEGIPIVPGVVTLNGAGGGFFYNPTPNDLDMVHGALQELGHEIVAPEVFKFDLNKDTNLGFAAMLYGRVTIAGSGEGRSVIQGSAYIQVTDQNLYLDANGSVLGLDGDGSFADAKLTGAMSLYVNYDPAFISGSVEIILDVPQLLHGEGTIEYFAKSTDVWGIIGDATFDILDGALNGDGEFLASNDGIMLTVGLDFNVPIPIITVKGGVEASVWILDGDKYSIPVGAYFVFNAEADLVIITISAEAKAALAFTNSDFIIYAAVSGCIETPLGDACGSAWAQVGTNGVRAGLGSSDHGNLIARAKQQREEFRARLEELKQQLANMGAAIDGIPPVFQGFGVSDEDIIQAGLNLYAQPASVRRNFYSNIPRISGVSGLYNNVIVAERIYKQAYNNEQRIENLRDEIEDYINALQTTINDYYSGKIAQGIELSSEAVEDAKQALDNLMTSMSESPVTIDEESIPDINNINSSITVAPSFSVDQELAASQVEDVKAAQAAIEKLDQQFRDNIAKVDSTLQEMHDFLGWGTDLIAGIYRNTYQMKEEYYALSINKYWQEWAYAKKLRQRVVGYKPQISTAIDNWTSEFGNHLNRYSDGLSRHGDGNTYRNSYEDKVDFLIRQNIAIELLIDSTFTGVSINNLSDDMQRKKEGLLNVKCADATEATMLSSAYTDEECITDEVTDLNWNFWYNMHSDGLLEIADQTSLKAYDIYNAFEEVTQNFLEPYRALTRVIDAFYTNQANLTAVLYNMIASYLYWKENTTASASDTPSSNAGNGPQLFKVDVSMLNFFRASPYKTRLQELANELKPPRITAITINPSRPVVNGVDSYYNKAYIEWSAVHPVGIIENSIDLIKNGSTSTNIGRNYDDYVSIGGYDNFTTYPVKYISLGGATGQPATLSTAELNIGVRVRGYAGNTAIRRATAVVSVGPEAGGVDIISDAGGSTDILTEDTSGPHDVIVSFPSYESRPGFWWVYWTNDSRALTLKISARDAQSGISTYKYAVGTTKGGTDVVDWTEFQGERDFITSNGSSVITGKTQFINMTAGQPYYISVQVINGVGISSEVIEKSHYVIFDPNPPTDPTAPMGRMFAGMFAVMGYTPLTPPIDPVLTHIPSISSLNSLWGERVMDSEKIEPELTFSWSQATDEESGVKGYEYVFSTNQEPSPEMFIEPDFISVGEDRSLTISGESSESILQDYQTDIYLHIRARDYAGNVSEIITYGPRNDSDPTAPAGGRLTAKVYTDNVILYYTSLPLDRESKIAGLQYSIGTSPGMANIKGWPEGETVDFESYVYVSSEFSHYIIPVSTFGQSGVYYINYRFVNDDGRISSTRSIGPIYYDNTKPPEPNISIEQDGTELQITINNIRDPETGVKMVKYTLQMSGGYNPNAPIISLLDQDAPRTGSFNVTDTYTLGEGVGGIYEFTFFIENAAGQLRIVSIEKMIGPRGDIFDEGPLVDPNYDFSNPNF